ncbi:MAG: hypothetical protein LC099_11795 [Anaerolineales bacterium]|nr:hypothetical protein [Anaerolineales bacterium]
MLRDKLFEHPKLFFGISFLLMLFGVVMPLLMVIQVVPSTFFWNFLSFGASTLGLFLGVIAVASSKLKSERRYDDPKK